MTRFLLALIGISGFLLQILLTEGLQREKAGRATNLIVSRSVTRESYIISHIASTLNSSSPCSSTTSYGERHHLRAALSAAFSSSAQRFGSHYRRRLPARRRRKALRKSKGVYSGLRIGVNEWDFNQTILIAMHCSPATSNLYLQNSSTFPALGRFHVSTSVPFRHLRIRTQWALLQNPRGWLVRLLPRSSNDLIRCLASLGPRHEGEQRIMPCILESGN